MLPINFASQHEEMLRTLNENLREENASKNVEENQPIDLTKPKYYTADYLKKKWEDLCLLYQKKRNARTQSDEAPNKRRKVDLPDASDEEFIIDPFENVENEVQNASPRD